MNPEENIVDIKTVKSCSFIRAFAGTCCGTGIFVILCRHRVWKMLAHLLLLSLLISFPVTFMVGRRARAEFTAAREIFVSTFGKELLFNVEYKGFKPSKNPEESRSAVFPGFGRIYYFPTVPAAFPDRSSYADLNSFAVWSPGKVSVVHRGTENEWVVNSFSAEGISFFVSSRPAELFSVLPAGQGGKVLKFSSDRLFDEIFFAYKVRVYITHAVALFVLPLIYALILLGVLRFTFARVTVPDYWAWWKCGVYAAFPGALIASAVTALDLPLISFTTAYMLSAMIYGLHAVMRIEYEKSAEEFENEKYRE